MQKTSGGGGHYAKLNCPIHGSVYLSQKEYDNQLNRPNDFWRCPKCNSHSTFDDTYFEEKHVPFIEVESQDQRSDTTF